MCWGIFWRPLTHKLSSTKYIIDGAMRLHNFIIDYRTEHNITDTSEMDEFQSECLDFCITNPDWITGTFGNGTCEGAGGGRPTDFDQKLREVGKNIRNAIRDNLEQEGYCRPKLTSWRRTDCSHVRMI